MASSKTISFFIILAGLAVSSLIFFSDAVIPKKNGVAPSLGNAFVQGGTQTINLAAKGGFTPETTIAKAGIPTVLRITTAGTFDCSSVISIPELRITKNLPNTGITEIDIGNRPPGILYGSCGMGMYPFEIDFQ
jgi:plastocyanin domain-containing protein